MDRCEITELFPSECAHCRPPAPRPKRKYVVTPSRTARQPIVAQFHGRCESCGAVYEDGETIAPLYEGPERVGWLGTCCQELWP